MKTMDILETKIREALTRKSNLESKNKILTEQVEGLRGSVEELESEKDHLKERLEKIIEKLENYLDRSEA